MFCSVIAILRGRIRFQSKVMSLRARQILSCKAGEPTGQRKVKMRLDASLTSFEVLKGLKKGSIFFGRESAAEFSYACIRIPLPDDKYQFFDLLGNHLSRKIVQAKDIEKAKGSVSIN